MLRTFHVEPEWVPPSTAMRRLYTAFTRLPEAILAAPAFVTELMGLTFYRHLDALLDTVLADEPEALDHVRALLHEIMADELSTSGSGETTSARSESARRGPWCPACSVFFRDIPRGRMFSVEAMIEDGLAFDYSSLSPEIVAEIYAATKAEVLILTRRVAMETGRGKSR